MTDTITESFCERCGTRYSFDQTAKPRRGGIGRVRVLGRGLKNYVANDGMPMAEAMAAAHDDEARAGVTRQLDAFHKTFNFCMSCRQYTCPNCWNDKVGECLTCAPDLSREVLPAPFPDLPVVNPVAAGNGHETADPMAWPQVDLDRGAPEFDGQGAEAFLVAEEVAEDPDVLARLDAFVAAPAHPVEELTPDELAEIENALATTHAAPGEAAEAGAVVADGSVEADVTDGATTAAAEASAITEAAAATEAAADTEFEQVAAVADAPDPEALASAAEIGAAATEPEAPATAEIAPPADQMDVARGQTRRLLGRFRPGHPAAGTPEPAAAAAALTLAAAATKPEPIAAAEPIAAGEPIAAAEPEAEPIATPETAPRRDSVEQPTWRVVAPEAGSVQPEAWPEAPAWPTQPTSAPKPGAVPGPGAAPWASRLATARPEPSGVWAASAQEVLGGPVGANVPQGTPAVQSCVSCGLSLSANARFCRRCGSRQG